MVVTLVKVHVKSEFIEDFKIACEHNHTHAVLEKDNFRFDILQQQDDPSRFVLYESYLNQAAANAHKQTNHYLQWKATVAQWMASPRVGIVHTGLLPKLPS